MQFKFLYSALLVLGLGSSSILIPRTSAESDGDPQSRIMSTEYWVNGSGAAEMIATAVDPLLVLGLGSSSTTAIDPLLVLGLGSSSSSIPSTSSQTESDGDLQSRIMNNFHLCTEYWVNGHGAAKMIAEAVDPLAVTKIAGQWAPGPFHTAWVSGSLDEVNTEANTISNLFPTNAFTPVLGPFLDGDVQFCGRLTHNPVSIRLNSIAFEGAFGFFEFSIVNVTEHVNAYTTVVKANQGQITPFYDSTITTANCTELAAAFTLAGTPVVSTVPNGGPVNSIFIRTITKRWEVVCGVPALPDPCAGRNYGSCATISALQEEVAALRLQAGLAAKS